MRPGTIGLLGSLAAAAVLGALPLTGAAAQARLVILVRHAEKDARPDDPVLTPAGEARARDLGQALANIKLSAVITTQYRRTQLTGEPVARANGITPRIVEATGNRSADAAAVVRALDALPRGSAALVVGHSNTLGSIVAALGGPALPDLCDSEFSRLMVLERTGAGRPNLVQSRYGAADPEGCGANAVPQSSAEAILRGVDSAWARSYATNDTALALNVMAPDFLMTSPNGRLKDRATEMADIRATPGLTMHYFRTSDVQVRIQDGTAAVAGLAAWEFEFQGRTNATRRRYTATYARGGPLGWQLIALQMGPEAE